jgi:hypothetical protein
MSLTIEPSASDVPLPEAYRRFLAPDLGEAADDACTWITYRGRHICITSGHQDRHGEAPSKALGGKLPATARYLTDNGWTSQSASPTSHGRHQAIVYTHPEMGTVTAFATGEWVHEPPPGEDAAPVTGRGLLGLRAHLLAAGLFGSGSLRSTPTAAMEAATPADACRWITKNGRRICIGGERHTEHGADEPRIYMRPSDLEWDGEHWKDKVRRNILSGPIAKADLPETLYHVTNAYPALTKAGLLLAQSDGGGLGGGSGYPGVSLTTSRADAELMQRELGRAIDLAQLPPEMASAPTRALLERWAREDEQRAGLPAGALQRAVDYAMGNYDANLFATTHVFDMEKYGGYAKDVLRPKADLDRGLRSLGHDAQSAYLQARASDAQQHFGVPYQTFQRDDRYASVKNPLIFGDAEQFRRLNTADLGVVAIPRAAIPDGALVRPGSDAFLHEIRVHADVPLTPGPLHESGPDSPQPEPTAPS